MLHQGVSEKLDTSLLAVFVEDVEKLEVDVFQNGPHHFLALGNQSPFFSHLLRLHQQENRVGVPLIALLGRQLEKVVVPKGFMENDVL